MTITLFEIQPSPHNAESAAARGRARHTLNKVPVDPRIGETRTLTTSP
jgi:hypothetical protein